METSNYSQLESLKAELRNMDEEELKAYVTKLNEARRTGPAKVTRSKATGAPSKAKANNPMLKLKALFAGMSEEEKENLKRELGLPGLEGEDE